MFDINIISFFCPDCCAHLSTYTAMINDIDDNSELVYELVAVGTVAKENNATNFDLTLEGSLLQSSIIRSVG